MEKFKNLRIVDNFYQTSAFFPMPTTLIGTMDENGETSFGAYSLVFPYYIASKGFYAMILECRNSSNTCKGLLRHGKCTINFMPDSKKVFEGVVELGFPGDTPKEKRENCAFTPIDGLRKENDPEGSYPQILEEAFQVMECTWVKEMDNAQDDKIQDEYNGPYHDFNGITSKFGAHFILKIDNILMKEKYYNAIINGVNKNNFPPIPTNFGYRDSMWFWESKHKKPIKVAIPNKEVDIESVKYAANRADDVVKFTDEACKMMVKIPRVFLPLVLKGCVKWAKENNCTLIGPEEMKIINDKRSQEKNKA